ncbi:hypothetical protein PRIC1_005377 [Phytophthora ramorum]
MQWVTQRVVETFEPNVAPAEVNEFLASAGTRKLFDELLSGKDACKVFVHFQTGATTAAVENGVNGQVANGSNGDSAANNSSKLYRLNVWF